MDATTLAYLAGAMDADGYFSIRKSTQRMRNKGDCSRAVYSPRTGLGQVTPQVPHLLKNLFGGSLYRRQPGTPNSRAMYQHLSSDAVATVIARAILPYLRIKQEQARLCIELWDLKHTPGILSPARWWLKEHPDWQTESMLTSSEVMDILGYRSMYSLWQATKIGVLVALPGTRGRQVARFPKSLVLFLKTLQSRGERKRYVHPPQFIALCENLWQRVRELNHLGVHGTPMNHRTGPFAPKE